MVVSSKNRTTYYIYRLLNTKWTLYQPQLIGYMRQ